MPGERHEQMRRFAHRILHYAGFKPDQIHDEYTITIEAKGGEKTYRIDVAAVGNNQSMFIEIGNNQYEKIANLRLAGYLTIVVPFSEKESEFLDEEKLLQIMLESNVRVQHEINKGIREWYKVSHMRIQQIEVYNAEVERYRQEIRNVDQQVAKLWEPVRQMKKAAESISATIPYNEHTR